MRADPVARYCTERADELWRPIAAEQRTRYNRGERLTHGLVELQPTSRRSERLLGPLQALLDLQLATARWTRQALIDDSPHRARSGARHGPNGLHEPTG